MMTDLTVLTVDEYGFFAMQIKYIMEITSEGINKKNVSHETVCFMYYIHASASL